MAMQPAPTIGLYDDTGPSKTDRITSDPTVYGVASGQTGASTHVTIEDEQGNTLDAFDFSAQSAGYRFKPTTLSQGTHTLTVAETQAGRTTTASVQFVLDTAPPAASSVSETVAQGAGATPIGLAPPSDNLTAAGSLAITAGALPTDGLVTLANGAPVATGQALTAAQLTGLLFTPTGTAGQSSAFTYTVTDGAGNAGQGAATLNLGAPGTPASKPAPAPAPAPDAVSISPLVSYRDGVFTLTGTASSAAGVRSVEISASVDGVTTDLGPAAVDGNGRFTFEDALGASFQGNFSAALTDDAGGGANSADPLFSLQGGLPGGRAEQDRYTPDGSAVTARDVFRADGSQSARPFAPGQTFASSFFDRFRNGGAPDTTFVFNPGFGRDTVNLFRIDGADHDVLSFKGSDFGATPADQLASVLGHARNTAAGLLITDPTASSPGAGGHDTVLLKGITKSELRANTADIAFHA